MQLVQIKRTVADPAGNDRGERVLGQTLGSNLSPRLKFNERKRGANIAKRSNCP